MSLIGSALIGAGGSLLSGLIGSKGAKDQNVANALEAQKNRDFQERMSNTAHTRNITDLKNAGLNPILSATKGGASSPGGAQANMVNQLEPLASSAKDSMMIASQLNLQKAQADKIKKETQVMSAKGTIEGTKDKYLLKAISTLENLFSDTFTPSASSAKAVQAQQSKSNKTKPQSVKNWLIDTYENKSSMGYKTDKYGNKYKMKNGRKVYSLNVGRK